jgi:hypothetical protein
MKNLGIRVFDNGGTTCDRYSVAIDNDVYFMSDNANLPNGVCMYAGEEIGVDNLLDDEMLTEITVQSLPEGVRIQIGNILKGD